MGNQDQFLLDSGFWGWLYKLLTPIEWLMTQIMAVFHKFMVMLGMHPIGFSWVLSIIFLVLVVQACVFPLFYKSIKGMRKMQAQMQVLQPKLMRIQNKYKGKNDPASKEAMQRETMKLYQDTGANPMGGCTSMLPMFVQGPVFMCMFYMLSAIPYIARGKRAALGAFDVETAKEFTSTTVFGVNVADNFTTAAASGKVVIGIFVALMCFCLWLMQYNSMKRNMPQNNAQNKQAETMQKMMLWIFPIMYIFSGVAMPFAVLVYWLTNNVCNLLRSVWQIYAFPTPGSPAAEAKEHRDHKRENERRARAGEPSIEEEELQKAKAEAERKLTQGYQREQPHRKRKNKKKK
ncbi:60Kd inner membrane protein [Bifidobacterium sp. DSM 109960]|uniref:Membrane protein insertase YidC n=1 Tax=Bifidobacterium erythrocebi TaxID=2675325 RepID=A0A7Y0EV58_9BIFI|nr:membrane protein insertase YidC [Bifidobacterium sp. DSM 109960]NMM97012.1 60Kd inner membrane protein [Bifidobacterium sp. DSM 109960]